METAIQVRPFPGPVSCPKCNFGTVDQAVFSRAPSGIEFPPSIDMMTNRAFQVVYCAGGKELDEPEDTQEPRDSEPMVRAIEKIAKVAGAIGLHRSLSERLSTFCVGVLQEHLHKTCVRCGYELLTECQDAGGQRREA